MPPAVRDGVRRPPSAPLIRVHTTPSVPRELADRVVLLDGFEPRDTHYLRGPNVQKRTVGCEGAGCQHCVENQDFRVTFYAPVLLSQHTDVEFDGRRIWHRRVLAVTHAARKHLPRHTHRGMVFEFWKEPQGGTIGRTKATFLFLAHEVKEPAFPIDPIIHHAWDHCNETLKAVESLRNSLPPTIAPPILTAPPAAPATVSQERVEDLEKKLEELRRYIANFNGGPPPVNGHRNDHHAAEPAGKGVPVPVPAAEQRTAPPASGDKPLSPDEVMAFGSIGKQISDEVKAKIPDSHPAKKPARRRKGGAK